MSAERKIEMDPSTLLKTLDIWHKQLQESNNVIDTQILREIMYKCRQFDMKYSSISESFSVAEVNEKALNIANLLSSCVNSGNGTIEEQSLLSTAYCVFLTFLPKEYRIMYLEDMNLTLTKQNYATKTNANSEDVVDLCFKSDAGQSRRNERKLAIYIWGIYQCDLLRPCGTDCEESKLLKEDIIYNSFNITVMKCLTYSWCTLLHFRNLNNILNKLIVWEKDCMVDEDKLLILLYTVFNNWENLISGVREWNTKIWKNVLKIIHKNKSQLSFNNNIINSVMEFPWNKAKYFALSEIISFYDRDVINLIQTHPKIMSGLHYSLIHSSMVSAGTDLYKVLLNQVKLSADWCSIFLELFQTIFLCDNLLAKRNLLNYWIPSTVNKYPELVDTFINFFLDNQVEKNYFAFISFIKFCRKNGYVLSEWHTRIFRRRNNIKQAVDTGLTIESRDMHIIQIIDKGLKHVEEDIRAEAFHVICETNKQSIPSCGEITKVQQFLKFNINNDSTPFRQRNLNSFTIFFIRIHDSYLRLLKQKDDHLCYDLSTFIIWLYDFLLDNLNGSGNYQRKVMSLEIFKIILQYLCPDNKKGRKFCRKGNQRGQGCSILEHLKSQYEEFFDVCHIMDILLFCIKDNTDDIRETAADILINYFIHKEIFSVTVQKKIFSEALDLCNSCMFYEAASGCLMMKIFANLNQPPDTFVKGTIHEYLLKEAFGQFEEQKHDLILSLISSKPLHGVLSALNIYLTNCTLQINDNFISSTTGLLDTVSDYYIKILALKSESGIFPPSFAEMGESIEEIIKTSSLQKFEKDKTLQLIMSDAHQLILNNIWLNLKVCCELSTTIMKRCISATEKTALLDISIAVLTKCRHKGAIEAAGVCLGSSIKHLTSLSDSALNNAVSKLLENLLIELTSESNHSGSITRRSAGLTILVHRIVTNDCQDEKPLFHLTMKILLKALTDDSPVILAASNCNADVANERDIPLARTLHLLCRTVSESSLSSYVIQYAHQLAYVCFKYLTSQQWQIRNAALQLYGSVVPKLIGQRKNQDKDTSEAPVSVDELFSHISVLWDIVKSGLKDACETNTLIAHSNIIPILSLLSSTARRYPLKYFNVSFFHMFSLTDVMIEDLLSYLYKLLGSPIYMVRNICAQIIDSFYNVNIFKLQLEKDSNFTENRLHGLLLTLKYYVNSFLNCKKNIFDASEENLYAQELRNILTLLNSIKSQKQRCYIIETISVEIQQLLYPESEDNLVVELCNNKFSNNLNIGLDSYFKTKLFFILLRCNEENLIGIVDKYISKFDILHILNQRLLNNILMKNETVLSLFKILLKFAKTSKVQNNKVYEIMYTLSSIHPYIITLDVFKRLMMNLELENFPQQHCHSFLLPLLCCVSSDHNIVSLSQSILFLSQKCKQFSKPENYDAETRLICAKSIKHIKVVFDVFTETSEDVYNIKKNVFVTAVWLLQDENCEVRKECAKANICGDVDYNATSPSIQLDKVLCLDFIRRVFGSLTDHFLKDLLNEFPTEDMYNEMSQNLVNPFNHQVCNVYWETVRIKREILDI